MGRFQMHASRSMRNTAGMAVPAHMHYVAWITDRHCAPEMSRTQVISGAKDNGPTSQDIRRST